MCFSFICNIFFFSFTIVRDIHNKCMVYFKVGDWHLYNWRTFCAIAKRMVADFCFSFWCDSRILYGYGIPQLLITLDSSSCVFKTAGHALGVVSWYLGAAFWTSIATRVEELPPDFHSTHYEEWHLNLARSTRHVFHLTYSLTAVGQIIQM